MVDRYVDCFVCNEKKGFMMIGFKVEEEGEVKDLGLKPVCSCCYKKIKDSRLLSGKYPDVPKKP